MSIQLSSNFNLVTALPLDDRTVRASIVARDAIPAIQRYDGLYVYIIATNETWQLQGGITNADWVLLGSGGSTIQNNLTALVNPTINDDSSLGYSIESLWFNSNYAQATGTLWVCLDATVGAAVWKSVGNSVMVNGAPTVADDDTQGYFSNFLWFDLNTNILYWCFNPATGAAIWLPIGGGGGGGQVNTVQEGQNVNVDATDPINPIVEACTEDVQFVGEITPAAITATTNNYNPTGNATASTMYLSATGGPQTITGLVGGTKGRVVLLHNIGTTNIQLNHEDAGSTAANRFFLADGANILLKPNQMILTQYDLALSRWKFSTSITPLGPFAVPSFITTSVSGTVNNWNPTGLSNASTIRITSTTSSPKITGIVGGFEGRILIVENLGTVAIIIQSEDVGSTAANRFHNPDGAGDNPSGTLANLLRPSEVMIFRYDGVSSRWREIAATKRIVPFGYDAILYTSDNQLSELSSDNYFQRIVPSYKTIFGSPNGWEIVLQDSGFRYQALAHQLGAFSFFSSITQSTGTGLNDLDITSSTAFGLGFTGKITFQITVSAVGANDEFDWISSDGASGSNVPMDIFPQPLSAGVQLSFGSITGHTLGDVFTFYIGNPLQISTDSNGLVRIGDLDKIYKPLKTNELTIQPQIDSVNFIKNTQIIGSGHMTNCDLQNCTVIFADPSNGIFNVKAINATIIFTDSGQEIYDSTINGDITFPPAATNAIVSGLTLGHHSLLTTSLGTNYGITILDSDNIITPITVDLSAASDVSDCLYEVSHTASANESNRAFRKPGDYLEYVAVLNQSGIGSLTVTVLKDTLSASVGGIIPQYNNIGSYILQRQDFQAWDVTKTMVLIGSPNTAGAADCFDRSGVRAFINTGSVYNITINTYIYDNPIGPVTDVPTDNLLNNTTIEIRVYL